MKNNIVVVGSCMMDFVCYAPRLPKEGETLHGTKFAINFGGKGANQCVAARKLGIETTMIARVGDDSWGQKYLENLIDMGINHQYVKKTPTFSNGIAQITVADSGANQIIIIPGANTQLSTDDITYAKEIVENAAAVICQLETDPIVAVHAMKICKGISILNGAPALDTFDPELFTVPSIFCVNELEAAVFAGIPVETVNDADRAINILLEKGCKCVIITLGSKGAAFATSDKRNPVHVSTPQIQPVDTTGAGDAFIGALAFLLVQHKDLQLKEVIKAACYIATESCKKPGTQISFPIGQVLSEYLEYNQF